MKEYLIIDIGTSSLRVLVMTGDYTILDSRVEKRVMPVTFDAEHEWLVIRALCADILRSHKNIARITVSSLLGWVFVDEKGNAVSECFSYMHKCNEAFEARKESVGADLVYRICGRKINPEWAAFKSEYLKETDPAGYKKAKWILSMKDFINMKLTGIAAVDRTSACYTMLYNVQNRAWESGLIQKTGTSPDMLPMLVNPSAVLGKLLPEVAEAFGVDTEVCAGSVDGSTGILGAGGITPKTMVSVMGTTDTSFCVQEKFFRDESAGLIVNNHVIPEYFLMGGPMGMYGGCIDWLLKNVALNAVSLPEMNALAEKAGCGSEGVMMIPALIGERAPYWLPDMRGTICGLEPKHTAAHIFRAIMEANGYAAREMTGRIKASGASVERVIAIGGGARSDLWLQIKADILNLPVDRLEVTEATAAGACMLAQLSEGRTLAELSLPDVTRSFYPIAENVEKYNKLYEQYVSFHDWAALWKAKGV